ncbi:MAG: SMC-Scp complex subunit ScpB, partial [Dehalococcoidia bacterium]
SPVRQHIPGRAEEASPAAAPNGVATIPPVLAPVSADAQRQDAGPLPLPGLPEVEQPRLLPPGARPLNPPANIEGAVESLLFVAQEPVEPAAIARALNLSTPAVEAAIAALAARRGAGGIRVQRGGGKVQLISAPEFGPYVERFLGAAAEQRLSNAALETLAIIAYRQPVTRGTLESIRGVNSERALATLRARDLVEEIGRAETVGHPVLFGTTMRFLEYFGLEQPADLPPLPEPE